MTSGFTLMPFFCTSAAASKIARACVSVISGYAMPRLWLFHGKKCQAEFRVVDQFDFRR
jgi:hypothetical protein